MHHVWLGQEAARENNNVCISPQNALDNINDESPELASIKVRPQNAYAAQKA